MVSKIREFSSIVENQMEHEIATGIIFFRVWGFPEFCGTFLGIPKIRIMASGGLHGAHSKYGSRL